MNRRPARTSTRPPVWITPYAFMLRGGGVRRMATELVAALDRLGQPVRTVIPTERASTQRSARHDRVITELRQQAALSRSVARHDVIHSLYYDAPLFGHDRLVVTTHDMIHERFDTGSQALRIAKRRAVRSAAIVACDSRRTADDLVAFGLSARRLATIPLGVSRDIFEHDDIADPAAGRPFLLYVGDREDYKNFTLLIDTLATARELDRFALVLVGGRHVPAGELASMRSRRRGADVIQLSGIDDRSLGALYRTAATLVITSRYEGFGLPLLEAFACGCPVASTGAGSLDEFDEGLSVRFDPDSVAQCRTAIHSAIDVDKSSRHAAEIHGRSFTWERTAAAYVELYDRLRRTSASAP